MDVGELKKEIEQTIWEKSIPWLLSVASLIVLFIIGNFLNKNIEWYQTKIK